MVKVYENGKVTEYTHEEFYGVPVEQIEENAKATLINSMMEATRQTADNNPHNILKACVLVTELARELHDKYGMTWNEIDELQTEAIRTI